jgi:hypothetical protein
MGKSDVLTMPDKGFAVYTGIIQSKRVASTLFLLHVGVIEDMLHAVPQPAAVGAVAEFHLRMRDVRFAAGRAGVERFLYA